MSHYLLRPTLLLAAGCLLLASTARTTAADEIEYLDLETSERKVLRVAEVTSETWAKVSFRVKRKGRGPEDTLDTIQVLDVKREGGGQSGDILNAARGEMRRGNYGEAARLARSLCGGGWKADDDTGERYYTSFRQGDPTGRNARPDWKSEYGHFLYAKALYLKAAEKATNRTLFEDALFALTDAEVNGRTETADGAKKTVKIKTGGFLARFAGGNSRFYAEALVLQGKALTGMGKYADAAKVFEELGTRAIQVPLHPKYAFEAAIGVGAIKEAQKDDTGAIDGYNRAAGVIISYMDQERRKVLLAELGRAYSRARVMAAAVKLRKAEKSGTNASFAKLAAQLRAESPESLGSKFAGKRPEVRAALIQGARDPLVRAVSSNAIGLAKLKSKAYVDAVVAFKTVTVVYFQVREQAARANYYLVTAAEEAAKKVKGNAEARAMYESMAKEAKEALETTFSDTEWARKG